jgi:hypothetical protein
VAPQLPPPDPHESLGLSPEGELSMSGPTAVFIGGPPTPEVDRLADAFLGIRPGVLIVLARD